jgi:hypothetical protein
VVEDPAIQPHGLVVLVVEAVALEFLHRQEIYQLKMEIRQVAAAAVEEQMFHRLTKLLAPAVVVLSFSNGHK